MDNIQYRIYCITEDTWVYEWAAAPPTECPNNAAHEVNPNSVSEVNFESEKSSCVSVASTSNHSYTKLYCIYYDTNSNGPIRRIQLVCRSTSDTTSYDIKVVNYDSQTVLLENTLSNTSDNTIINVGTIASPPAGNFFLEIYAKANNGSGNVEVQQVLLYASQPV
jgi:hypothetical protein